MMQFTLSSLLISFVVVSAAFAAFGPWAGVVISVVLVGSVAIVRNSIKPWHTGKYVGCVLMIAICGMLLWPVIDERKFQQSIACRSHMQQLGFALKAYHQAHGHYPPAYVKGPNGKPWHSWRVLILPYLECMPLYNQYRFNEPWNGPNNSALISEMPAVYSCPSNWKSRPKTNYLAVVGPQAAWLGETPRTAEDFSDACATIQLVEIADSEISWMEPRDVTLEDALKARDSKGHLSILDSHLGPAGNVAMVDGSVHRLYDALPTDSLRPLLTIDADKTGSLDAATRLPEIASSDLRTFLMQSAILLGAMLVLLLRPKLRWRKQPTPTDKSALARTEPADKTD